MLPFFARAYDSLLCGLFARFVRPPRGGPPRPEWVPASPEEVEWPGPLRPDLAAPDPEGVQALRAPSPLPSPWPESRELRGRLFGPSDARAAVLVLHGACDNEYTYCQWMGRAFEKHGFRVVVPAAPAHLERAPEGTFSGAALFWSTELVVAGLAQWLAEIHGLLGWLRAEGVERVGLIGYSLGSLAGGLAATLWPDLDFVALLAPVGHHLQAVRHSRVAAGLWPWMRRVAPAEEQLLDRWAPVNRQPVLERLLFLITQFDVLQPTALQRTWWQTWGRPPYREYPDGHMSVLFCRQLYRDLEAFAQTRAMLPAAPAPPPPAGPAIPGGAAAQTGSGTTPG